MKKNNIERVQEDYRYLLVIDLERNCGKGIFKNDMRLIEVGACIVDLHSHEVVGEFGSLIDPNCELGDRIKKITKINNEELLGAPSFEVVNRKLINFLNKTTNGEPAIFCSWGGSDYRMYKDECNYFNIEYPFHINKNYHHFDFGHAFRVRQGFQKSVGSISLNDAISLSSIVPEVNRHRALYDARDTAKLTSFIFGEDNKPSKLINPFLKKTFEIKKVEHAQRAKELNKEKQKEKNRKKLVF